VAIVNGYIGLPELKSWLRLPGDPNDPHDDDPLFEAAVNGVSRYFDHYCRRHFYQVEGARDFEADDYYTVMLGTFSDLSELTTLTTDDDGDGVFETTWAAENFELGPSSVLSAPEERPWREVKAIGQRFPMAVTADSRMRRIRIQGTWGWPAIPDSITQATKIQCSRIIKRREAPEGILGLNQFGVLRVSNRMDPDVRDLVKPYRLRQVG
jgi:hypothetical protein